MRWISRRQPAPTPAPGDLRDQLNELIRSWWRTSDELHATTLKPGASLTHRQISDAQARILNTAAHELNQLLKDADQ